MRRAGSGSIVSYRLVPAASGKLPLLIRATTGMPSIEALLWADHISTSLSPNSTQAYAKDLLVLHTWSSKHNIDIDRRFMALTGLSHQELRSLAQHALRSNADPNKPVKYSTYNRRLASFRSYIEFQMDRYLDRCGRDFERYNAGHRRKESMLKALRRATVDQGDVDATTKITEPAPKDVVQIFNSILHPLSELNPFKSHELRVRNYTLFHTALAAWSRRGELVLLEIDDLHLGSSPTIKFTKKQKRVLEERNDGADLKTRGRIIPIASELAQLISTYIDIDRPKLVAGRSLTKAVFVSQRDGKRLAAGTVNYILEKASCVCATVAERSLKVHPHVLRATGATDFRRRYQDSTKHLPSTIRAGELQDILTYIGGWSTTSSMPRRYTRQAILERIDELLTLKRTM